MKMKRVKGAALAVLTVVALSLMSACDGRVAGSASGADSVQFLEEDSFVKVSILAEPPQTGDASLLASVGRWMSETLGDTYAQDMADIPAIVEHYGKAINDSLHRLEPAPMFDEEGEEIEPMRVAADFDASFRVTYETDRLVSYLADTYIGASTWAHPSSGLLGATFRKDTGERLGWDIIDSTKMQAFRQLLVDELCAYADVTRKELVEMLSLGEEVFDLDTLPLPQSGPCLEEAGITFCYQQYELLSYAMGIPSATIPYAKMKPLLTPEAQQFLPRTEK